MISVFQRKLNDRPTSDYSSEVGDDTLSEPATVYKTTQCPKRLPVWKLLGENGRYEKKGFYKMRMTMDEKKLLYAYGCENYSSTVKRMALAASITVNSGMKEEVCKLHNRLAEEITEPEYKVLYPMVCSQMRLYGDAEHIKAMVEDETVDMFENIVKR